MAKSNTITVTVVNKAEITVVDDETGKKIPDIELINGFDGTQKSIGSKSDYPVKFEFDGSGKIEFTVREKSDVRFPRYGIVKEEIDVDSSKQHTIRVLQAVNTGTEL